MLLPAGEQSALLLLLFAFICLGSWASIFKASRWRFELFYLDFAIGSLVLALLAAYTLGNIGSDMSFMDRTVVAGLRSQVIAVGSGLLFGLGTLLLLAAVATGGLSLAFPFAFGLGFLIALAAAHLSHFDLSVAGAGALYLCAAGACAFAALALRSPGPVSRKTADNTGVKTLALCVIAGILFGISEPLGDAAFWGDLGLGPYAGTLFFTIGLAATAVVFDIFFMNIGLVGGRVRIPDYKAAKPGKHLAGIFGGFVFAGGFLLLLLARSVPGGLPAWSVFLSRGWVLLAAVLGLFVWKERSAQSKAVLIGWAAFAAALVVTFVTAAPR